MNSRTSWNRAIWCKVDVFKETGDKSDEAQLLEKLFHHYLFSQSSVLLVSHRSPRLPQRSGRFISLVWRSGLLR